MARHRHNVRIGQQYQKKGAAFMVWEVSRIYEDLDGISHALLIKIDDPTNRKTLAVDELSTGQNYVLSRDVDHLS